MTDEQRLRELMHDPGWALPPWPDAEVRIRRAARRQRAIAAGIGTALTVVIAAAVLAAGALLRPAHGPEAIRPAPTTPPTISPSRSPSPIQVRSRPTPPLGSAGFPARLYPAAVRPQRQATTLALCPAPAGLQAPGPATPAAAASVLRLLAGDFLTDLRVSDRSGWPYLASRWHPGGIRLFSLAGHSALRYSGPLRPGTYLPARLVQAVVAECGLRVANATWVIVTPSAHILFVTRHNHMFFYSVV